MSHRIVGALVFGIVTATLWADTTQLDLTNPKVRKMLLDERKRMDCAGIYQQTKLKLDAQLKLGSKVDASAGLSSQTVATMTEVTTALGQKRRDFCELYRVTPEFAKEDYFRAFGELDKGESDVTLLFRYAAGKANNSDLKQLQTVKPQETGTGSIDVNATLKEVLHTVDSVAVRVDRAETKIAQLETDREPRHLTSGQKAQITQFLRDQPTGSLTIEATLVPDARGFAEEIASALRGVGWKVQVVSAIILGDYESTKGLRLTIKDPAHVPAAFQLLGQALLKSGVALTGQHDSNLGENEISLIIGPK